MNKEISVTCQSTTCLVPSSLYRGVTLTESSLGPRTAVCIRQTVYSKVFCDFQELFDYVLIFETRALYNFQILCILQGPNEDEKVTRWPCQCYGSRYSMW